MDNDKSSKHPSIDGSFVMRKLRMVDFQTVFNDTGRVRDIWCRSTSWIKPVDEISWNVATTLMNMEGECLKSHNFIIPNIARWWEKALVKHQYPSLWTHFGSNCSFQKPRILIHFDRCPKRSKAVNLGTAMGLRSAQEAHQSLTKRGLAKLSCKLPVVHKFHGMCHLWHSCRRFQRNPVTKL